MSNLYRRPLHVSPAVWDAGVRRSNRGFKEHRALDIAAPEGTRVYSMRAGKVVEVDHDRVYGYFIRVRHANGVTSKYAHLLHRPKFVKGDRLELFEQVGQVGCSGLATGNHLHWQVRVFGLPVDPDKWVRNH